MPRICPLTKGACVGDDCLGYSVRNEYSVAETPNEYLDTAPNYIIANNISKIPVCKLFGDLPQEEAK